MPIRAFTGPFRFLSNFYRSRVRVEGIAYPTAEHAYQAMKTTDLDERKRIASLPTPGEAKRAGRKLELCANWSEIRLKIMKDVLHAKFEDAELETLLLETGDAYLEESNTWGDTFWGSVERGGTWVGQNNLGKLLMQVRDEIRREHDLSECREVV